VRVISCHFAKMTERKLHEYNDSCESRVELVFSFFILSCLLGSGSLLLFSPQVDDHAVMKILPFRQRNFLYSIFLVVVLLLILSIFDSGSGSLLLFSPQVDDHAVMNPDPDSYRDYREPFRQRNFYLFDLSYRCPAFDSVKFKFRQLECGFNVLRSTT